ncbi:MAG: DinB family protein [Flavobacteriaceae bacterium]
MSGQELVKTVFLEKWENSKIYLTKVAQAMPEDKYNFKPTEREMSFTKQIQHICENMLWLSKSYISDNNSKEINTKVSSKKELLELIELSFSASADNVNQISDKNLSEKVDFFAGEKNKLQILNLMQDHVTHHRGQLIVYLNLNGIKPPRYTGW